MKQNKGNYNMRYINYGSNERSLKIETKKERELRQKAQSKKKKYKLNKAKLYATLLTIIFIVYLIISNCHINSLKSKVTDLELIINTLNEQVEEYNKLKQEQEEAKQKEEEAKKKQEEEKKKQEEKKKKKAKKVTSRGSTTSRSSTTSAIHNGKYRITSYHPEDNCSTGTRTGSGKSIKDFQTKTISGKKVYTYNGKIVVATATKELLRTGYSVNGAQDKQDKHYFKYYDTLQINIDGTYYDAIVLDSCGAAMWQGYYRIDIFVPSASNVIDRSNVSVKI